MGLSLGQGLTLRQSGEIRRPSCRRLPYCPRFTRFVPVCTKLVQANFVVNRLFPAPFRLRQYPLVQSSTAASATNRAPCARPRALDRCRRPSSSGFDRRVVHHSPTRQEKPTFGAAGRGSDNLLITCAINHRLMSKFALKFVGAFRESRAYSQSYRG